jgi:hypothetical protein
MFAREERGNEHVGSLGEVNIAMGLGRENSACSWGNVNPFPEQHIRSRAIDRGRMSVAAKGLHMRRMPMKLPISRAAEGRGARVRHVRWEEG